MDNITYSVYNGSGWSEYITVDNYEYNTAIIYGLIEGKFI